MGREGGGKQVEHLPSPLPVVTQPACPKPSQPLAPCFREGAFSYEGSKTSSILHRRKCGLRSEKGLAQGHKATE